jgi:RNA recognition motif-containing protein
MIQNSYFSLGGEALCLGDGNYNQIRELFKDCGPIAKIRLGGGNKFKFVDFETEEGANNAYNLRNTVKSLNGKKIFIDRARC